MKFLFEDAFEEKDYKVKFQIIIDGLKVSRRLTKAFAKYPDNATVNDCVFQEQSMNYAITFHPSSKTYRFQVKRLPCPIDASKTKIKVVYLFICYFNFNFLIKLKNV
jgi:hypothetical protein